MSDQTASSRPTRSPLAGAMAGALVTLVAFLVVILSFLIAPLALFGVALGGYLVLRPRRGRRSTTAPTGTVAGAPGHGFGSGVR